MKKYFLSIVALAGMLFATSCQESLVEPQVGGTTTFTVQVPDQMGTKADPTLGLAANVNQLFVAVYADASANNATPIYRTVAPVSNGQATVSLNLIQGQYYDVIFWAQVDNNYVSADQTNNAYTFDLVNIPMNKDYHNTDNGAAFFYYWNDFEPTGTSQPVTLRRPFAQLNLGTTYGSLTNNAGTFTLQSSVIKVKGIADNFNTVSGFGTVTEANKDIEYTFDAVALPSDNKINVAGVDYKYVSMDYLPIVGDNQALITVDATITLNNGQSINHKFTNVPVRENYRTNIVGNLISSSTDFNVVVDDRFVDENNNPNPDNNSWVVENTAAAQAALDNAKSGDVIRLVAGVNYAKLELRPTQANVVKVTTGSHGEFSPVEKYLEHLEQNPNVWHSIPHYTAEFKDITIIGAEGATIEGFVASSGHMSQANVYDYVRDAVIPNGGYYSTILISNLKFENVNFTGKIDINSSDAESVYEGVTFEGCTFTTGGTASANGAAIRYYNENNNGQVKNITVKDCSFTNCYQGVYVQNVNGVTVVGNEFETTGHNAIGVQGSCDLKNVLINNNTFNDIRDRIIRFNNVGADSYIEIRDNVATNSGDENGEVIKATSIAIGVVTFIKDNDWGVGAVVGNNELNNIIEVSVSNLDQLETALENASASGAGNTTIVISADINMTGQTWTPINVQGYTGAGVVTILGNNCTITGLTSPLFAGGFAGKSGIIIKDLTIADSHIVSTNTLGSGAFIETVDSMPVITLVNCHVKNSDITGGDGSRTGGLIGWTAGYSNVNDGPVKTYVTIIGCSVVNCTITCNGSVGGIYGHAGSNDWTCSTVEDCTVTDCILNSTDDGEWRVGVVVGTANVGDLTINNITESGNTLTQTGKTAPAGQSNLYGRFVPGTTGKLVIDGVEIQ